MEEYEIDLPLGEEIKGVAKSSEKHRNVKHRNVKQPAGKRRLSKRARRRRRQRRLRQVTAAFVLSVIALAFVLGIAGVVRLAVSWCFPAEKPETSHIVASQLPVVQETGGLDERPEAENQVRFPYAYQSDSYIEITDTEVRTPYIALLAVENNQIIAGRSYEEQIYPASMTKVMTLIVAVENIEDMNDTFVLTDDILYPLYLSNASVAGFLTGEEVSARDLLYGLILPSGADAAEALAQMTAGSEAAFVELMNVKCRELGLQNTHFCNVTGLHNDNHYTTPAEMAMIMNYAMKNPVCASVLSEFQYTTAVTPQHPEGILLTSTMFSRMYGDEAEGAVITAGKTGFTDQAGNCLVSYAAREDRHYIAVTAGAGSKWHPIFDDFKLYESYAR